MGIFANLYRESGAEIPKEKIAEFKKRLEVLYQVGGMMELERVSLFGKTIGTIHKVAMHEYGMDFYYNYFEEFCRENAGFSIKGNHAWSEKIAWRQFHTAVVAAYAYKLLANMAKNKEQGESFITKWTEGQKYVINDTEHQSKAFVPIYIDAGNSVEIVQVDGGLITGLPKGEVICDNLVYTIKDSSMGYYLDYRVKRDKKS